MVYTIICPRYCGRPLKKLLTGTAIDLFSKATKSMSTKPCHVWLKIEEKMAEHIMMDNLE